MSTARMTISRRDFVLASLAAPVSFKAVTRLSRQRPMQNSKLRVAKIGCGGMGNDDLRAVASHPMVEIVALCDVDRRSVDALRLGTKDKEGKAVPPKFPQAKGFADWRELFSTMEKDFDAVVVSTPDHMHAAISMAAMNMGKHVYCQKPLAHGAWENRRLAEVAATKPNIVTQMGTQRIATKWRRYGAKLMRDGVVGRVSDLYAWTNRPAGWWPQGGDRPQGSDPIPEWLSWDLFLGVSPERPYKDGYTPFNWRGTIDWGTGAFGDMGCHMLDVPFYELELGMPRSVRCDPEKATSDQYPERETVVVTYAAGPKTGANGLKLHWFDGGRFPDFRSLGLPEGWEGGKTAEEVVKGDGGVIAVGEKGVLWFPIEHAWSRVFVDGKPVEMTPEDLGASNHWHDWVDACLAGKKDACVSRFEKAGRLCESLSIGAVSSLDPGKELVFDASSCAFANSPTASRMLRRTPRAGWSVANL